MSFKVSVIVPVYNVEKYLSRCLDSLVNQTLSDIQIIVVNDGTKDNSQLIIDEYVKRFPHKVFSYIKENGGLSDARNYGLKFIEADYIGFVDSDDYVEVTMYEKLYKQAIENNHDLVVCDIQYFWEDSKNTWVLKGLKDIEETDVKKKALLSPLFAWNKLYHKDLFLNTNLRYPTHLWYEDIPVTTPIFALSRSIGYVNEVLVHYQQRSSSIMGASYSDKLFDIFKVLELMVEFFENKDLFDKYHAELEYIHIEQLIIYGGFRFLRTKQYSQLLNHSLSTMNLKFKKWRDNFYLSKLNIKYKLYVRFMNSLTIHLYRIIFKFKY
jgi:glycosyltransferase involved in cell wall biosynthesis